MTPEQINDLLATPDAFREWLRAKEPEEVVGQALSSLCCPLARFIGTVYDPEAWSELGAIGRSRLLPRWGYRFFENVDRGRVSLADVTAAEALEALR